MWRFDGKCQQKDIFWLHAPRTLTLLCCCCCCCPGHLLIMSRVCQICRFDRFSVAERGRPTFTPATAHLGKQRAARQLNITYNTIKCIQCVCVCMDGWMKCTFRICLGKNVPSFFTVVEVNFPGDTSCAVWFKSLLAYSLFWWQVHTVSAFCAYVHAKKENFARASSVSSAAVVTSAPANANALALALKPSFLSWPLGKPGRFWVQLFVFLFPCSGVHRDDSFAKIVRLSLLHPCQPWKTGRVVFISCDMAIIDAHAVVYSRHRSLFV